jgi:hypothetical protein
MDLLALLSIKDYYNFIISYCIETKFLTLRRVSKKFKELIEKYIPRNGILPKNIEECIINKDYYNFYRFHKNKTSCFVHKFILMENDLILIDFYHLFGKKIVINEEDLLIHYCANGKSDMVNFLIKKFKIKCSIDLIIKSLFGERQLPDSKFLIENPKFLLEHDIVTVGDVRTACFNCVYDNIHKPIPWLIKMGIDIKFVDEYYFRLAIQKGNFLVVRTLVNCGANLYFDGYYRDALEFAYSCLDYNHRNGRRIIDFLKTILKK